MSSAGYPQSNGRAEKMNDLIQKQARALKYDTEARRKTEIHPGLSLWAWLVRHAAFLRGRFGVKANGHTAYFDAFQTEYKGALVPFGEGVLFQKPRGPSGRTSAHKRALKGDTSWHGGVFLGRSFDSNEALIGTDSGVFRARTFRRREAKDRFS